MNIHHKSPERSFRYSEYRKQLLDIYRWSGHDFQIDDESRILIQSRAVAIAHKMQLGPYTDPIYWRTAANFMFEFTPQEFLDFQAAVDSHVESTMTSLWSLQEAIKDGPLP